jgi:hypothetical protein
MQKQEICEAVELDLPGGAAARLRHSVSREHMPAILFIDDADSIAVKRRRRSGRQTATRQAREEAHLADCNRLSLGHIARNFSKYNHNLVDVAFFR